MLFYIELEWSAPGSKCVARQHLVTEKKSVTKKCDGQTARWMDAGQKKNPEVSAMPETGNTKSIITCLILEVCSLEFKTL